MSLTADNPATAAPGIDYVRRTGELAPELAVAADQIECRRELREPIVAALVEHGFFRLLLPRSLGGAEPNAAAFAGVAMGIACSTLDAFVELARDKVPFRSGGALRDNHLIQSQIAQARRGLPPRAFLLHSLEEITAEVARAGHIALDQRMEIRLASTFRHPPVVDTAYHTAGSTAIFEENRFERRFRDIHTVSQQLQGRSRHFETVGQYLLGPAPDSLMCFKGKCPATNYSDRVLGPWRNDSRAGSGVVWF